MPAPVDPFPDFQPGQIADANQVDARFAALYAALANGAIGNAQLADDSVDPRVLSPGSMESFLQLAVAADRKLAWGITSLTFNGNAESLPLVVPHGLGKVPVIVMAVDVGLAAEPYIVARVRRNSYTTTEFTAIGQTNSNSGVTATVGIAWLAIG